MRARRAAAGGARSGSANAETRPAGLAELLLERVGPLGAFGEAAAERFGAALQFAEAAGERLGAAVEFPEAAAEAAALRRRAGRSRR